MMGAPGLAFETWDPPRDPGTPNWRTLTSRKPSVRMPLDRILTHTLKPDGMCVRTRVRRHLRRGSQAQKRDPPNFLYVALDRTACAPFYTERRIECGEPTKLRRKSGTWGTHHLIQEVLTQTLRVPAGLRATPVRFTAFPSVESEIYRH